MTDLFSSIDAGGSFLITFFPLLFFILLPSLLIFHSSPWTVLFNSSSTISQRSSKYQVGTLWLSCIFLYILRLNFLGLTPLIYRLTTNIWFNSSLALIIWRTFLLSGYVKDIIQSLAHLVPSGSPLLLIPFLVLIETISILIRPLTLTVRLLANISAGHIILTLISTVLSTSLTLLPLSIILILLRRYQLFEIFVCIIQAYIFTLLLSLYLAEHP